MKPLICPEDGKPCTCVKNVPQIGGEHLGCPREGRNRAVVCNFDNRLGPEEYRRKVGQPKKGKRCGR